MTAVHSAQAKVIFDVKADPQAGVRHATSSSIKMPEPQTLKQYWHLTPGINDPLEFAAESHCTGSLTLKSTEVKS